VSGGLLTALLAAGAQQPADRIRRVGVLAPSPEVRTTPDRAHPLFVAFQQRMGELGYTEGRNIVFEVRRGSQDRLLDLAADLLSLEVEAIVAWGNGAATAAKRYTTSVPIVVAASGDLVEAGLVASLARPGGNVTGVSFQTTDLFRKRAELLRELVPGGSRIGMLWDSTDHQDARLRAVADDIAQRMRLHVERIAVPKVTDLDKAFAALRRARVDGVLIAPVPRHSEYAREVARMALAYRLVAVFSDPDSVNAGGLMAYYLDWPEMARTAASYVDQILKGAKPGDLPIQQPTKFLLLINLKTARALGLTIPPSLLQRADQIIE
jgi:putative ABC transport system substrate-binding protein